MRPFAVLFVGCLWVGVAVAVGGFVVGVMAVVAVFAMAVVGVWAAGRQSEERRR